MTRPRGCVRVRMGRLAMVAFVPVSVLLLSQAGAAYADAGPTSPAPASFVLALQQLTQLNDRVDTLTLRVATLQDQVRALTSGFDRASERIAHLQEQRHALWGRPGMQTIAGPRSSAVVSADAALRDRIGTARAQLRTLQQRALADPVVTRLFRAQARLDEVTSERDEALSAVATLQAAGIELPANPSGSSIGYGAWAAQLLETLGAPVCQSNMTAVVAWESAENTTAEWNPLATTLPAAGGSDFNPVGVKDYPSLAIGLAATADTLRYGLTADGYGPVVEALQACAPPEATAAAINQSLWCRGCAGGRYVTGVLPAVEADYTAFASRP